LSFLIIIISILYMHDPTLSPNELYVWVNKYIVVASKVYLYRVLGSRPRIAPATLACVTYPLTMLQSTKKRRSSWL
jgi:hypothetical protein